MKILIAEDDLTSRTMLQAILTKWGFDVTAFPDGEAALAAMQCPDAPQLVILDWMMPGKDGPTLCRELRAQDREDPLYLILLTSRGGSGDIVEGLEAGADDYIAKPYDSEELRARVSVGRRVLELQEQLREKEKLQGVLEMAGAVCHEFNQPLQSISGFSELLLMETNRDDPGYAKLINIKTSCDRLGALTRKIMGITKYSAKPYVGKTRIVDLNKAAKDEP